jgi:serine/threonine protein kinase
MTSATTKACPKCTTTLAADAKFCPNCGASVSGIFSGGGTPQDGTAQIGSDQIDTVYPMLAEATIGDYDIYGELGRGGMAAVYLALDLSLNRKVAIKTMLPELVGKTGMVDRFKREAQTAAALSHPHIIQIFSVKQTKNLVYFVMKYIEGRSLESVIIERGRLDVDLTRVILSQVGAALAFAHRKGVVHRDMKPANIMLEEDGWAIVTDFGIAKVQEAQNLTATGTAIGTPHYMSPEQFHNKAVTGASDQYSLGVVAYEMLSGKKPFDGGTYAEIITQHLFEPPPDIRAVRPDIPENIAAAVMKMMAKEASARFPDLDAAVASLGTPTTTQGEKARTQIISIAKSNQDERKARMSVPKSPIPVQRAAPAPTVVESGKGAQAAKKPATPRPKPVERKSSMMLVVMLLLVVAGGGTFGWYKFMGPGKQTATVSDASLQQSGLPQTPVTTNPSPESLRTIAIADSIKKAFADSVAYADSVKNAADLERQRQQQARLAANANRSTKPNAGSAKTQTGDAKPAPTETKPAASQPQQSAVQPDPKPEAPAEGAITIGTRTANVTLFINGVARPDPLGSVETIKVKAGSVTISLQAEKCRKWDTTIVVPAGVDTPKVLGRKILECTP